jgi:4-hydroxybenzoate polyprenyltransferase
MIDGITILKQYHFVLSIGLVILISVLLGILAALIFEAMVPGPSSLSLDLICGLIIGLVAFACIESENTPNDYYDVIIDNSVSVNELYKDYEILKVDGKIYTIALREK